MAAPGMVECDGSDPYYYSCLTPRVARGCGEGTPGGFQPEHEIHERGDCARKRFFSRRARSIYTIVFGSVVREAICGFTDPDVASFLDVPPHARHGKRFESAGPAGIMLVIELIAKDNRDKPMESLTLSESSILGEIKTSRFLEKAKAVSCPIKHRNKQIK